MTAPHDYPAVPVDLVSYFAGILSEKINKELPICKGLIRGAMRDELGEVFPPVVNYHQFRRAMARRLPGRLNKLSVAQPEEVTRALLRELADKQALFTVVVRY
ncbi:MAG: hypothetical protein Kow0069_30340 [Promethearchaeota archaeon]